MALAIVLVVAVEDTFQQSPPAWQLFADAMLLGIGVQLRPFLAQKEQQVNLPVVVGKRCLRHMAKEAGNDAQHPYPYSPVHRQTGYLLGHQAQTNGTVDEEEPHVAGKAVEHTPDERLLSREARHLSVGGVAEVGKHQQQHATEVVPQVVEIEHHAGCCAEENGEDGDHIRVDAQPDPAQGEEQTNGAREMHVQPLFCVVRLEGGLQQFAEAPTLAPIVIVHIFRLF